MKCASVFRFSGLSRAVVALALTIIASAVLHAGSAGDGLRARIAEAEPGALILVPAGTYEGPFVIDK